MVSQIFGKGGLERILVNLALSQQKQGFEVTVFTYAEEADSKFREILEEGGVRFVHHPKGEGLNKAVFTHLRHLVSSHDIVHTHDGGAWLHVVLCSPFIRCLRIHTCHSSYGERLSLKFKIWQTLFSIFTKHVIGVSPHLKFGLFDRYTYLPNGTELPPVKLLEKTEKKTARQQVLPQIDHSKVWFFYCCRFTREKGLDELLEAWSHIPEATRSAARVIVLGGDTEGGYRDELWDRVVESGLEDEVVFHGATDKVFEFYPVMDAYLSFSQHEGTPLTVIEALGCGLPCILSDIPGHSHFSKWASFFQGPNEAAEQIREFVENKKGESPVEVLRQRSEIEDCFSLERMIESYSHLYGSPFRS